MMDKFAALKRRIRNARDRKRVAELDERGLMDLLARRLRETADHNERPSGQMEMDI